MKPSTLIGASLNALDEDALFHIFSSMTFEDLATFRTVSQRYKIMADTYIFHLWRKALSTFVDDVDAFRHLLRRFRAIVSGSVALHAILHGTRFLGWKPNDMDICCCLGQTDEIVDFLHDSFGYHRLDGSTDLTENYVHEYQGSVASVVRLHHPTRGTRIDVISSLNTLPEFPIPAFWGTLVMNWFSADRVCIAYPRWTLQGLGCIRPGEESTPWSIECINKYRARGFHIIPFNECIALHPGEDRTGGYCSQSYRFFKDPTCLAFDFSADSGEGDPVDSKDVQWVFGGPECFRCRRTYPMSHSIIR